MSSIFNHYRLVVQVVRRLPPTAVVPSLHLGHSIWVSWQTKWGGQVFLGISVFPTKKSIPPFLHTYLIHFISSTPGQCDRLVGQHPCYSLTFNILFSLQPTLKLALCRTQVEEIIIISNNYYINITNGCPLSTNILIPNIVKSSLAERVALFYSWFFGQKKSVLDALRTNILMDRN